MESEYILKDTEQIKRMKEHALLSHFGCSGEIYKLLSLEVLHNLVKKIKKGKIKLLSTLLYEKGYVTYEEHFIILLDKYIGYVRDNYLIPHTELILILEETLKNKYSRCLLDNRNFYDNYDYYSYNFKLMFLYNFISNIKYYSKLNSEYKALQKVSKQINMRRIKDKEYLNKIEAFIRQIINNRGNNICNCFIYDKSLDKRYIDFYTFQIDWVLEDYYKKIDKFTKFDDNRQKSVII